MINDCKHYTYFLLLLLLCRINFAKRIKLHYVLYKRNIEVSEMKCFCIPTNHNETNEENPEIFLLFVMLSYAFEK